MKRLWQLLKFVFVGFGNAIIDLGVFNGLYFVAPTHNVKRLVFYNTLAVGAAILNSYIWNSRWTFRQQHRRRGPGAMRQRVLFLIQSLINVVVNDIILGFIAPWIAETHAVNHVLANNIAKVLAMFLASLTSFVMMKLVVFV
ncbi:GtrA family protein [Sulfobacillus harzensis]|uniref:GtrA family protein n=1 Tax=Sulfobacillus harzensis TaxID=2729629 RepID=A0A7Y0L288_9FIRM|nr:GtrA family protein [Sulfobacillus harzensis]NMP21959.1 GtrA family protein [Sulfobacillus harzensis]